MKERCSNSKYAFNSLTYMEPNGQITVSNYVNRMYNIKVKKYCFKIISYHNIKLVKMTIKI